jgi:hypothetical protein
METENQGGDMNRNHFAWITRRGTVLAAAAAVALAMAPTAAATAPTSVDESFHRSIPNFVACSGFTVRGEFDVSRTVTTFYDNDGATVRQVTHVHFTGELINTATGKSIPDEGNQIVISDLTDGTTATVGRVRVVTVPHEGEILAQVGRVVRDASGNVIFIAGQQDFQTRNFDEFCAYMASL